MRVHVRMAPKQFEAVARRAHEARTTISEFIRSTVTRTARKPDREE